MPRRVFHLVQDGFSPDTVQVLERMLAEAKDGELLGIAYVAMYRRRQYTAGAAGECRRNPTFTRGMLAALNDLLGDLVRQ